MWRPIKEAQEYLGWSAATMDRALKEDPTFPAKFIRGRWKYDPKLLDAWIEAQPGPGPDSVVTQLPKKERYVAKPTYRKCADQVYSPIFPLKQ